MKTYYVTADFKVVDDIAGLEVLKNRNGKEMQFFGGDYCVLSGRRVDGNIVARKLAKKVADYCKDHPDRVVDTSIILNSNVSFGPEKLANSWVTAMHKKAYDGGNGLGKPVLYKNSEPVLFYRRDFFGSDKLCLRLSMVICETLREMKLWRII